MGSVIAMTPSELVTDSHIYSQPQPVVTKVSSLVLGYFVGLVFKYLKLESNIDGCKNLLKIIISNLARQLNH